MINYQKMGLFDYIFVHKSLVDNLDFGGEVLFQQGENGHYVFQTKDLDNSLTDYYIESDGSFFYKKQEYEYVPPKKERKGWNFGDMVPIGEPEITKDLRSAYIQFYDIFNLDEERVSVTFIAHVKKGKLVEPISIKNIERKNLEEERKQNKFQVDLWEKIRNSREWKLADLIFKFKTYFEILFRKIDKLEFNLREKAKNKFNERID